MRGCWWIRPHALPDAGAEPDARVSIKSLDEVAIGPKSAEALRESRSLKVSHTMVGMTFSELEAEEPALAAGAAAARPLSNPPPVFTLDDEPVQIPTTGLAPSMVGALVVVALIAVSVFGFLLLR